MGRANQPVDNCPSLSLTTASYETVIQDESEEEEEEDEREHHEVEEEGGFDLLDTDDDDDNDDEDDDEEEEEGVPSICQCRSCSRRCKNRRHSHSRSAK